MTPKKYNPFTMVVPKAPPVLSTKKKIDFSLIAPKTDQLATQKWITNQVVKKRATANILSKQVNKIAETSGKIWQANVVKQQVDATKMLWGMTEWINNDFIKSKDVWLKDYYTTVQQNPDASEEDIMNAFPEFKGKESVLKDYYVTLSENPDASEEEIRAAFPEIYELPKIQPKVQTEWWDISINKNPISDVKNAAGWLYRSVVDIPQSITESWILDAPVEYVARWPVWEAIRSWAKSLFWEKELKEYQAKEWWKKFSEVAKGMTVWDPNSKLYQWSRVAWDVLQSWVWVAQVAKSIAKSGTKKAVLNMLKEADTVWGKRAALSRWWLDTQWPLSKFLKWSKDLVKPSKRTLEATDEVVNTIKWASKNPQKLYTQISTKISDIWSDLSSKLKTINIKWSNISTKELNTKLIDLSNEIKDISPTMWKKLQVLSKNITNSPDADEFRKSLQQLDDMIPENVKSWIDLSWKDQYIYDAWRVARWAGNDLLDNIANNIPDTAVKKSFKSMSNLYHAKWQISQNIWRLTPKVTWIWTKLTRAWKWLAGTVVAGKVLQELWVFD